MNENYEETVFDKSITEQLLLFQNLNGWKGKI
jgi:hypothetical protein